MKKRVIPVLFVFFVLVSTGSAKEQKTLNQLDQTALTSAVTSILKKVDETEAVVPDNRFAEEGKKRAQQTAESFNAPEFQSRIKREQQRLNTEVFKKYKKAESKACEDKKQNVDHSDLADAHEKEKIYLFLSSSLPAETMHEYLADIARVNTGSISIVPVMQGMIKGIKDKKANLDYFKRILKEDMSCVEDYQQQKQKICERFKTNIHFQPPWFAKYGINQVPALVYDNGDQVYLIQGDASLDYLLERINRKAKQERLGTLIKKIRGGINE